MSSRYSLDDPLAQKCLWSTIRPTSSVAQSRRFRQVNSRIAILESSRADYVLHTLITLILSIVVIMLLGYEKVDRVTAILAKLSISLPFVYGLWIFPRLRKVHIIDREKLLLWKYSSLEKVLQYEGELSGDSLEQVHALQLIYEKRYRYSYFELNIVFKSGKRHFLMVGNSHKSMQREALKLARFLSVPLWDFL